MTPTQIESRSRNRYNAVNDTFFSQQELLEYMTDACNDLAKECLCIERTYTTLSVQGQREYAYPTNTITIKRIEYNGRKINPITFRDDDSLTLSNTDTTQQGSPLFYEIFENTIYLRTIPDTSDLTIKIYSYNLAAELTINSALEIPTIFHNGIYIYVTAQMAFKDQNYTAYENLMDKWTKFVTRSKMFWKRQKRGDAPAFVQDVDDLNNTILGAV